jgi:hypothetical protein
MQSRNYAFSKSLLSRAYRPFAGTTFKASSVSRVSVTERTTIVSEGRKARLQESPREGLESGRKPAFRCERETPLSLRNARFHESPADLAKGGSRLFCSDEADRTWSHDPRIGDWQSSRPSFLSAACRVQA